MVDGKWRSCLELGKLFDFCHKGIDYFYESQFDHGGTKSTNPSSQSVELDPFLFW